jgi:LAO/AO transport system kinase
MNLAESVLAGNRLALARLLTHLENGAEEGRAALSALFPHTGRAHLIGVTGAPGTGKSSLVNQLARLYRQSSSEQSPRRVGIIAVDPSSPFTGGALLGDRVRMRDLAGDPGVFIRSMASRGSLGGLARATADAALALDAAGFEVLIIETVGAGQAEVDIARLAHTTVVVEAPGLGDDIQAIKAGILEIADVLVINKADRPGVENTERALRNMLELAHPSPRLFRHHGLLESSASQPAEAAPQALPDTIWVPPIQRTVATEGTGVAELGQAINRHREHLVKTGGWQRHERFRLQTELDGLIQERLLARWRTTISSDRYEAVLQELYQRSISPWQAVASLIDGEVA